MSEIKDKDNPEEYPVHPIDQLPGKLGYIETDDLKALRMEAVDAVKSGIWPHILNLRNQYAKQAQEIISQLPSEISQSSVVGLTITLGQIMRDGGRLENYAADLQNAHLHALNLGLDDDAAIIEGALVELGQEPEFRSLRPSREKPKRQLDEDYLAQLNQFVELLQPIKKPMVLSFKENELYVNSKPLEANDGPAVLWAALSSGKEAIDSQLQNYRQKLKAAYPDKEISPDIPFMVMYLADYPRLVLTDEAMDKIDHFQYEFYDIQDVKEEFRELWMAVDATGYLAEIRLLQTRSGWLPIHLWARAPGNT